ncbi:MAG: S41 family peptidase [Leeuwenhoekiella sp.]
MKKISALLGLFLLALPFTSCQEDLDDVIVPASENEINDFIYKAMNVWYLYKPQVPALANDRFSTQQELNEFLNNFSSPESFYFDGLVIDEDRFSFIVDDYRVLEDQFAGVSKNNGMNFGLVLASSNSNSVLGFVRYVLPNTSASENNVERGLLFNSVNGVDMFVVDGSLNEEAGAQLAMDTYTITVATVINGEVIETGEEITLTKVEYTSNPVFITKTLDVDGIKVGYLMYNSFTSNFNEALNNAFGELKAAGIDKMVLDLRYNGGGAISTATDLGEMITGQFNGDIFASLVYNPQIQAALESQDTENLLFRFDGNLTGSEDALNTLGLTDIAIITTSRTASASELVINGLEPYIDVIQVGETTTGKFQGSRTLYDSDAPNFGRNNVNPNHFYAIQPLILTSANADGTTGFINGLAPDIAIDESPGNLGILGDPSEPLLAAALAQLTKSKYDLPEKTQPLQIIGESGMDSPLYQEMYILPEDLQ